MGNKQTSEQKPNVFEEKTREIHEKAKELGNQIEEKAKELGNQIQEKSKEIGNQIQTSFEGAAKDVQEKAKALQVTIDAKTKEVTKEVQTKLGLGKQPVVEPWEQLEPAVEENHPQLSKVISTLATNSEYTRNIAGLRLLPAGSAFYTSSGKLHSRGILGIIHAATGSSSREGRGLSPTVQSVANSVRNALILAQRRHHRKIAIPFIGGAIFLNRLATTPEVLATAIIKTSLDHKGPLKVALVPYGAEDTWLFQQVLEKLLAEEKYADARDGSIEVCPGDITRPNVHGADVIVNAANMEARFGGGVSGAIARATDEQRLIDQEASKIVAMFIEEYINQHSNQNK
jgi:O-acetyl-ADP-ribose deacetylase (regulator of RNase III)/gas vesicle protein